MDQYDGSVPICTLHVPIVNGYSVDPNFNCTCDDELYNIIYDSLCLESNRNLTWMIENSFVSYDHKF